MLLATITYPDDQLNQTYSAGGLLHTISDGTGTISNKYDALSRWAGQTGPWTWDTITVVNGTGGLPASVTSVGVTVQYAYDIGSRLSSISGPAGTFNYTYNPTNGLIAGVSCATGGINMSYTFDVLDRPAEISWKDASNTVLRSFAYSYNTVGMITQKVTVINDQPATNIYTYDSLDRLMSESSETSEGTHQTTWTYDLAGNRLTRMSDGSNMSYSVGLGNRLTSWSTNGQQKYDAAGNATNVQYDDGRQLALKWDSRYRMTAVSTNGGSAESYGYDALDRRISISDGATTNYLICDGIHVIAEVGTSGSLVRSYVYGPGIDNILSMTVYGATTNTYYYIKDHLGSVQAIVDASGSIVESYQYDAWGNVLNVFDSSGSPIANRQSQIGNRYLWQGREISWKTGLYFFRARWYDPVTGRWLSNDPIGISGGLNQYVFCSNNPVNFVDPTGLDARTVLLPFGFSFSFHKPFTQHNPGEDVHEQQHRKDWSADRSISGWEMEQRAFAAQAAFLRQRIKALKNKKCQTDAEQDELFELKLDLGTAESIAGSEAAAKAYWNSTGRQWWQEELEVKW